MRRVAARQADLFGAPDVLPEGVCHQPGLLIAAEEAAFALELNQLPFEPVDFQGHSANRRVGGFGYRNDDSSRTVRAAAPIAAFLSPVRERIAAFADQPAACSHRG